MKLKDIIAPCSSRVKLHTKNKDNEKIKQKTEEHIRDYQGASNGLLQKRLDQLDCEWDTERVVEASAASLILASSILGFKRRWCCFVLSALVGFFLLLHAIQGWCPMLSLMRCLGVRTPDEINEEKAVIKSYMKNEARDQE